MFFHENTELEVAEARIEARRLRIEKRNRVLRGENIYEEEKDRDDSAIEKQIEESNHVLERLTLEGNELASSVIIAGSAREVARREREARAAEERVRCLAEEQESAELQLSRIQAKWTTTEEQCDALELFALLQEQKRRCRELLAQKDAMAERLRVELADRRAEYEQTLKEQGKELMLAAERVDQQVASLQQAQRDELALLETVTEQTRSLQVQSGDSKWIDLWESLQRLQEQRDEDREKLSTSLAQDEDSLHEQMAEKLHEARTELQQKTQAVGLELQALRASCCLNAEKMKLNTELLRTRDQEARVLRAAQKRRINKLQDKLRSLQADAGQKKESAKHRRKLLRERVKKLRSEVDKTNPFPSVTQIQIKMLVEHGVKQAAMLIKQITAINKTLTMEQLCLPWNAPERINSKLEAIALSLIESRNPIGPSNSVSSSNSSSEALHQAVVILTQAKDVDVGERALQKLMLKALVGASGGFLSPEHPGKKMDNISEQEKMLMELAACLSALGVETETDLHSLFNTLRALATCTTCEQTPFIPHGSLDQTPCTSHEFYLGSQMVLQALKQFTAARAVEADESEELKPFVASKTPSPIEDTRHELGWEQFEQLLPENMEELWNRLHDGLTQHLTVLQDRHEINTQVIKLQNQNAELRRLLQSYALPNRRSQE